MGIPGNGINKDRYRKQLQAVSPPRVSSAMTNTVSIAYSGRVGAFDNYNHNNVVLNIILKYTITTL